MYHTHGLGWSLSESAPNEEAISDRKMFVKCNSRAPIICFETSKTLDNQSRQEGRERTRLEMDGEGVRVVA